MLNVFCYSNHMKTNHKLNRFSSQLQTFQSDQKICVATQMKWPIDIFLKKIFLFGNVFELFCRHFLWEKRSLSVFIILYWYLSANEKVDSEFMLHHVATPCVFLNAIYYFTAMVFWDLFNGDLVAISAGCKKVNKLSIRISIGLDLYI